jgi:hypothetical protein
MAGTDSRVADLSCSKLVSQLEYTSRDANVLGEAAGSFH